MRERSWSCEVGEDLGGVGGRGYRDQNIPSEKVFFINKKAWKCWEASSRSNVRALREIVDGKYDTYTSYILYDCVKLMTVKKNIRRKRKLILKTDRNETISQKKASMKSVTNTGIYVENNIGIGRKRRRIVFLSKSQESIYKNPWVRHGGVWESVKVH